MLQSFEVQQALINLPQLTAIVPASHIFCYAVPEEFQKVTDQPVIRIDDIRGLYNKFASNHAYGAYRTVEIQGWFNSKDVVRADKVRRLVNTACESIAYYNSYDGGFNIDPNTAELMFTTQYTKDSVVEDDGMS
ncbi:hypothetical protein [Sporolactobacillus putidus]|uniref:Uncharacterized protein n=1 Tax=Sporolactobacillus putidus TaxID=492735 RepID=A0A917S605_9BACL|nr:hypothetical protein [Sporolactobacillus putidus]GGL55889.1 hypothetical protein GCM10007968_20020 [Sporolactobacillus putidus]